MRGWWAPRRVGGGPDLRRVAPPSLGSAWGPQALPGAPSASLRAFLTGKKPFRRAKGEARARGATFLSGTLGRQKSGHAPLSQSKGLILKTPGPAGCRRRSGGEGGAGKGRGARGQRRREMAAEHKVRAIAWPPGGRGRARATPPPPRFPPPSPLEIQRRWPQVLYPVSRQVAIKAKQSCTRRASAALNFNIQIIFCNIDTKFFARISVNLQLKVLGFWGFGVSEFWSFRVLGF